MVKHKSWVDKVERVRGENVTRHGLLRLDKNERVTAFPESFLDEIRASITSDLVTAYPEPEQLYQALAAYLGLEIENLMLTAGSDAAIRHAFDLFVRPGDQVIVLEPTFAMVDVYCGLFGANRCAIKYDTNLQLDTEQLIDSIGDDTALAVIANPNSPTGTLIDDRDIRRILLHAMKFNVPVFLDEAYHGFCSYTAMPLLAHYPNLIVSRTFSKATGLAGLRVGYLAANKELAQLLYRFRPMYEVNAIGILAVLQVLRNAAITEEYVAKTVLGRQHLLTYLKARSIPFRETHTNFIHINFGSRKRLAVRVFEDASILVRGGLAVPGFEDYLRITIGPEMAMATLIDAIESVLSLSGDGNASIDIQV